jgi:hypothetical protein
MIVDMSFRNAIQKFFESCKIEMCLYNISAYYNPAMKKNPLMYLKKGIREIDLLHTTSATIQSNGIISPLKSITLFFDEESYYAFKKENLASDCYFVDKSVTAVLTIWKVITSDNSIFYTYRDVNEIKNNSALKIKGITD